MAIGRHEVKLAQGTHLKEAIAIALDEALTAFEESMHDLSDAQARAFPVEGENNIAWIAMHCLDNLDEYAVGAQTGTRVYDGNERWDLWQARPDRGPKPGDPFPTVRAILDRLSAIRAAATAALGAATEDDLLAPSEEDPRRRLRADWYMRTICHTNSHVRQIWLLRGLLGVNPQAWPQQHSA